MNRGPTHWSLVIGTTLSLGGCAMHRSAEHCPAVPASAPVLLALRPDSVALAAVLEERATVTLVGCAFGDGPVHVSMGPARIGPLTPTDAGSRVQFVVPAAIPSRGEAPPMTRPAGTFDVVLTSDHGRSGARTLTVY